MQAILLELEWRLVHRVVDATHNDGPIRIAADEVDQHLLANARQELHAPLGSGPSLHHTQPARCRLAAELTLLRPIPVELHQDPSKLIGPDVLVYGTIDHGRLRALYARHARHAGRTVLASFFDRHAGERIGIRRRLRHLGRQSRKHRYVGQGRRRPVEQQRQPRPKKAHAERRHDVRHRRQRIEHLVDVGHVVLLRVVEPIETAQRTGDRRIADQLGDDVTRLVIRVAQFGGRKGHRGYQIVLALLERDPLFLLLLGNTDDPDPRSRRETRAHAVAVEHLEPCLLLLDAVRREIRRIVALRPRILEHGEAARKLEVIALRAHRGIHGFVLALNDRRIQPIVTVAGRPPPHLRLVTMRPPPYRAATCRPSGGN